MRRMQKKQIECAAADLSPAYTKAVREDLPNSVLVSTDFISCRCCIGRSRTVDARSIANCRTKPPAEPLRETDLFC